MEFLVKVNPDTQFYFADHEEKAFMGDYPTLTDIDFAYGKGFSVDWLIPQLANLSLHTGAKNLTEGQQEELAKIIAKEYKHYKITELLLFFYRFKTGRYGRFYGSVDPIAISSALRDFDEERSLAISRYEQQMREREQEKENRENPPMNTQEWHEIKTIIAMYNSEFTT